MKITFDPGTEGYTSLYAFVHKHNVMDLVSTLDSETYKYVSDPSRATSSLLLSDFNTVLAPISVTTDMSQTLLLAEAVILRIGHCKERACR